MIMPTSKMRGVDLVLQADCCTHAHIPVRDTTHL
jgi:hypothetical protein